MQHPTHEHTQFDRLCEPLDEWDTLPAVVGDPTQPVHAEDEPDTYEDEQAGQILAGLVSP